MSNWPMPDAQSSITCCYHCPERCVTEHYNCHSHCKKYAEQCQKNEERKAKIREQSELTSQICEEIFKAYTAKQKRR